MFVSAAGSSAKPPAAEPFDFGETFWMEPTGGSVSNLAAGDSTGAVVANTPTYTDGPEYHAGIVPAVNCDSGDYLYYPNVGAPFRTMTTSWWVAGAFRVASTPNYMAICGNGAVGASWAGFSLRLRSNSMFVDYSDGSSRKTAELPHRDTFPLDEWVSFCVQAKVDVSGGKVTLRGTFEGFGIYTGASAEREVTGLTLAGAPFWPGLAIGAQKETGSGTTGDGPFAGDLTLAGGELPGGEFFDDRIVAMLDNFNRHRRYADAASYNETDFVHSVTAGPQDSGVVFAVRSDVAVKAEVFDQATRTLQGSSALVTPTDGFAQCSVTGLTAGQEVYAEFEDSSGDKAWWEWHHRVTKAGHDQKIAVAGCWLMSEDPSLVLNFNEAFAIDREQDPDFILWTDDHGYWDPAVHYPAGATAGDFKTLYDLRVNDQKTYRMLMRNSHVLPFGDHDYENDGDSTSTHLPAAVEFFRRRNPTLAANYRVSSGDIGYSLVIGGYRIIVLDIQTQRLNASQLTSAAQRTWFAQEIAAANTAGQIPIINWGQSLNTNKTPIAHQNWAFFAAERTAYFDLLAAEFGVTGKRFISVSGDTHDVGLDDGGATSVQSLFDTAGLVGAPMIHAARFLHPFSETGRAADYNHYHTVGLIGLRAIVDLTETSATEVAAVATVIDSVDTVMGTAMNFTLAK